MDHKATVNKRVWAEVGLDKCTNGTKQSPEIDSEVYN